MLLFLNFLWETGVRTGCGKTLATADVVIDVIVARRVEAAGWVKDDTEVAMLDAALDAEAVRSKNRWTKLAAVVLVCMLLCRVGYIQHTYL